MTKKTWLIKRNAEINSNQYKTKKKTAGSSNKNKQTRQTVIKKQYFVPSPQGVQGNLNFEKA